MAKRRGRKPSKQPASDVNNSHEDGVPPNNEAEAFDDREGIKFTYTIYRMLYFYELHSIFSCPKCEKEVGNSRPACIIIILTIDALTLTTTSSKVFYDTQCGLIMLTYAIPF